MPDSGFVFAPAQKLTSDDLAALNGGYIEVYEAGTSTPKAVYSDAALTSSLGSTVYLDSSGNPVASSGSSTKVSVYTGAAKVKLIIKTSAGVTVQTIDNLQCAQDTSLLGSSGSGSGITGVYAKSADYTVTTSDTGKWFSCDPTSGEIVITFPSAITAGNGFAFGLIHSGTGTTNRVRYQTVSSQTILINGKTPTGGGLTGPGQSIWFTSDGANWSAIVQTAPRIVGDTPVITVESRLASPPTSPSTGARYLLRGTLTGAWAGFTAGDIVEYDGAGTWTRTTPPTDCGWLVWIKGEDLYTSYQGSTWVDMAGATLPTQTVKRAIYQHITAQNTAATSLASGSWQTVPWTTEASDDIGITLSSNKITPTVTNKLRIDIRRTFTSSGSPSTNGVCRLRLKNDTAGTVVAYGEATPITNSNAGTATLITDFTPNGTDAYVVEAYGSVGLVPGGVQNLSGISEYHGTMELTDLSGVRGATGPQGSTGADGADAGWKYTWSSNTSASDPSSGGIKGNNATLSSITALYISETDADTNGLANEIASWDDSTSTTAARSTIKIGNSSGMILFKITGANTDNGTWVTLTGSVVASRGALSGTVRVAPALTGDKGDTGATGSTGPTGSTGATGATGPNTGLDYAFNTATSGDPGSGKFLYNNATIASVTEVNISKTGRNGESLGNLIATWDDSTNTSHYGHWRAFTVADRTKYTEFEITGLTDNSTYYTLTITNTARGTLHANNDVCAVMFERTGNKGADGAGTGDVSGPASSTNNSLARFDGTTGKLLKDGAVIGTDVQAYSAALASWSAITRATGFDTFSATPSSANLAAVVTDETGTGALVFANSPTLVTPALGTPSSLTLTNATGLPASGLVASTSQAVGFGSVELGHATDTTLSRSAAGRLAVEGKDALLKGQTDSLTAGYSATSYNAGTKSSGTFTPDEANGNLQYAVNGGAHTLAPPTNATSLVIQYTNNGSAGTITTSSFTKVTGDSLTTTNGDDFMLYIMKNNAFSHLHVQALQ